MKKTNNKTKKEKEFPSSTLFIAFVILSLVLLFSSFVMDGNSGKIKYTEFLKLVDDGKVDTVSINSTSGKITYTLKGLDGTYTTSYPYTDDFIEQLLLKDINVEIVQKSALLTIVQTAAGPLIVFAFFIAIYIYMSKGGMGKEEELVKSNTTFADVAGMDEIKEDLLLISEMMKDTELKKSGARIPRGILLEGPPGNGKTLLARAFAGETNVNFIAFNACDTSSPLVGVGSMKIKSVFEKAKKNTPCVIFIDELDAVGSKRSERDDSASKEMNSILTSLLNYMDGFTPNDDIMVIAATNRADSLDPALVRPGRFDRKFVVGLPDKSAREALFELYIKKANCDFDVDISKLATKTYGYSSSEIECIVNEAIINSIKHKDEITSTITVTFDDFNEAILSMGIKGKIKKNYKREEKDNTVVAYHEAGHAISTYFTTNKKVSSITIAPTTSGAGGFTVSEFDDDICLHPIKEYYNEIVTLYAGRAAEYVLGGNTLQNVSSGASNDIQQATKLSINYVELSKGIDHSAFGKYGMQNILSESEAVLKACWEESVKVVSENWKYVDAVAKELIDKEKIESEDFEKIIKRVEAENV